MKKEPTWIDRKGKEVSVKDMDTSYIKNCLNMIKRTGKRLDYVPILEEELRSRFLDIRDEEGEITIKNLIDITQEEMEYFISLNGGYDNVVGINNLIPLTNDGFVVDYLRSNTFYSNDESGFLKSLEEDLRKGGEFDYKKYNDFLLENVFTKLWVSTISVMLGRFDEN